MGAGDQRRDGGSGQRSEKLATRSQGRSSLCGASFRWTAGGGRPSKIIA
jgi:hypothetical protein